MIKGNASKNTNLRHFSGQTQNLVEDYLIIEEPLLIALSYFDNTSKQYITKDLTVIMRTPGNDSELITGFLFNEQIINNQEDIIEITIEDNSQNKNHHLVKLAKKIQPNWKKIQRTFASQSSCGICGKTYLNGISIKNNNEIDNTNEWLNTSDIIKYANDLSSHQPLFTQTGGVHGAGYIINNEWVCTFEDVGRHNAVDKMVGYIIQENKRTKKSIIVLSGRVSFEIIQKSITAAIPVIIAIGAPTSLAVKAAIKFNITLIGFARNNTFNVYHGNHRINYNANATHTKDGSQAKKVEQQI